MPEDGDCILSALRRGTEAPSQYSSQLMRRQLALWMAVNAELLYDEVALEIMLAYGEVRTSRQKKQKKRRSHNGPFSYVSYIRNLLQCGEYGDSLTIGLIALMWQIKITTVAVPLDVSSAAPIQWRYNHKCGLKDVDLLLLYNGQNHYSAGGK